MENISAIPEISVIVVTYNQEKTLARTLDSILEQKLSTGYEILICDDASVDKTASIAREYHNRFPDKIRLFINEKNLGVQRNYFNALRNCRGEYIADCAGDDFWIDSNKLQEEYNLMHADKEITIVHTGWNYFYENGVVKQFVPSMKRSEQPVAGKETGRRLLYGIDAPALHLCTALYRKDAAIKALNENEDIFLNPQYKCEDLQLAYQLCLSGKVAYFPRPTLNYSVGHESLSSEENFGKSFDFYYGTLLLRLALAKKTGIPHSEYSFYFSKIADYLTAIAFRDKEYERALKINKTMQAENLQPSLKTKIYRLLMSNRQIWNFSEKIFSLVKR